MTFKVLVNWCKKETWKLQTGCHVTKLTYPIFFRFLNSPNERGEREIGTRSMLCSDDGKKQTKYFFHLFLSHESTVVGLFVYINFFRFLFRRRKRN